MKRLDAAVSYIKPITTARETGLWMLLMSIAFVYRPYAAAITTLNAIYGVNVSVQLLGVMLALFGGILIVSKHVGRIRFLILFSPMWIYAFCLTWAFLLTANVGVMGTGYALWCCFLAIRNHARDESIRENIFAESLNGKKKEDK